MDDQQPSEEHAAVTDPGDLASSSDCVEALQELYVFLDGELTAERRSVIRHHLDDCNPCLEAFDFEAELKLVIQSRCRDEVPPGLRDRVARALDELRPGADAP